jgi:hypothetical protein
MFSPRDAESGNDAALQRTIVKEPKGWKLCRPWSEILRGTREETWQEWQDYKQRQSGLGKITGNECGFVAAARCARILGVKVVSVDAC